ncbi:putative bifunctional diguanylate cyclase/phosphodiesterase [Aquipuribacter hungaricus]|uniref:guanylate cyclase n=1 Tax=Aquipuribacter hungaricus TaxID=545624 RepID=A0ABV7WH37_9MICO
MSGGTGLGRAALDVVCPFHLVVDADGVLVQVGPSLTRAAPALRPGCRLADVATVESPGAGHLPGAPPGLVPGGLLVLRVTGSPLALRGHVVSDRGQQVFIGSPWVTDLAELAPLGLTVSDFAVSDPVLDHLLLQQVQRHALAQSRELASRLQATAEELHHRASYDELTGLANRAHVTSLLAGELPVLAAGPRVPGPRAPAPAEVPVAVLLLDLDDFKDINGGLGHAVGDEVLRQVAARLVEAVRSGDAVARLGGDEFVVLLPGVADAAVAVAVAEKLIDAVGAPLLVQGSSLCVGATVGIAVGGTGPDGGDAVGDGGVLLRQADLAMYRAKQTSAGWAVFGAFEDDLAAERVGLVAALRRALSRDEVTVAYQPVVVPGTGRTVGFEALARWHDAERGQVPPDRFVPVAEQSGLVVPLTRAVLRRAVTDCAAWRAEGHDVDVAVNLSVHAVRRTDVPAMVAEELRASGLDARYLTVELTEGALVDDSPRLGHALAALRALGVTLSIDDFGTGFSSMSYLKRLPVQALKVDRSFVRDIETDPRDRAIVATLVQLAHGLGLSVVAEGVESDGALHLLATMGCDLAQGYAMSRPMPGDQVRGWLQRALVADAVPLPR